MRPITLTMTAFGPYAGTEVVDFREATDAGLFGIYGATGSGKSSIFSAMTFALFGEGAKKEQPIATMRSGHADADRMTEVSLLFEMGGRRYFVRRQPEQTRPKKRGEGETSDSHKAWLFDVTEVPVDDVTSDNCGVVLAETKVGDVQRIIRDLLGYGVEQFRQIVLLPQGRFERFLVADSNQRVDILRELFDVDIYRRVAKRMKDEAAAAKREFEDGHRIVARRLAEGGYASTDELAAGIAAADEETQNRLEEATAADEAAQVAEQAHLAAEAIEGRFKAAEMSEGRVRELGDQAADIDALQIVLSRAESAERAIDLATRLKDLQVTHAKVERDAQDACDRSAKAEVAYGRSEAAVVAERGNVGRIEGMVARVAEIDRLKALLVGAGDLKEQAAIRRDERADAWTAFDRLEGERAELETRRSGLFRDLEAARVSTVRRAELCSQLASAKVEHATARAHHEAERKVVLARGVLEKARVKRDETAGRLQPLRDDAIEAERAFIDAQAQLLAGEHLVDGQPCPVCGSSEHPSRAQGEGDPRELEERMRAARKLLDDASRDADRADATFTSQEIALGERVAEFQALAAPKSALAEAERAVSELERLIDALGEAVSVSDLEHEVEASEVALTAAVEKANAARDALQKATTDEAVATRAYDDAIAGVPEASRGGGALDKEAEAITETVVALRDALQMAEDELRKAATARDTAAERVAGATDAATRAEGDVVKGRADFEARLAELGLDARSYELGCADVPAIATHAETIRTYREDVIAAEATTASAREVIRDVERPDFAALSQTRDSARSDCLTKRKVAADADAARRALYDLLASLQAERDRLAELEQRTGPLRGLADAFAGENPMRIPLETFAIGAMFDHVLAAANLRLDPMTAGRYRLERDAQLVGGRTKRGLDIRVHDIEIGRAREVSTLSGGETFIAALSLALGLSDVVEMSHGRIRLDTIFIDEGFGSLDTENDSGTLDRVLRVLQEIVGRNRAVGLISHVPMVQQAVPNGFSVIRGVDGSRVERRVA